MKIQSLHLRGYKRLGLSGIHDIHIKVEKRIVCLLGSNGSGKTSIIRQLSPLPGLQQQFYKDGFKIFCCEHNKQQFRLESHFDGDRPRYLFIVDGENLNPGRTLSVYRSLVLQYFNVTEEIHEVMIGATAFDAMQVGQRRQWFTKMPGVNYEYAISYYKKLKERHKEIAVLLKGASERLLKDKSKILNDDQIKDMMHGRGLISVEIERLLWHKDNSTMSKEFIANAQRTLVHTSSRMMQMYNDLTPYIHQSSLDYSQAIEKETLHNTSLQAKIHLLCSQIEHKQEKAQAIHVPDEESVRIAPITIQELELELKSLQNRLTYLRDKNITMDKAIGIRTVARQYEKRLYDICPFISTDLDKVYDQSTHLTKSDLAKELSGRINNLQSEYNKIAAELKHVQDHKSSDDTQCPKCSHTWKIGYSPILENTLLNKKTHTLKLIDSVQSELDKTQTYLEHSVEQKEYLSILSSYYKAMSEYIPDIDTYDDIRAHPMGVMNTCTALIEEVYIVIHILDIQKKVSSLKDMLKADDVQSRKHKDVLLKEIEALSTQYSDLHDAFMASRSTIAKLKASLVNKEKLTQLSQDLIKLVHNASLLKRQHKSSFINDGINKAVTELKSVLAVLEHSLFNAEMQKSIVKQTEHEIQEQQVKLDLLKKSLDYLSPVDGLIAHGLKSFLTKFMYDMNTFIQSICTYHMSIVCEAPNTEDLDLDFRFDIEIEGSETSPDASATSSGQKEIIGLAFRHISMKYRDLKTYPVFLDEFGGHMDHVHKQKALKAVTDVIIQDENTQIFLVSHFVGAYGSLANAQFVVLHSDNIVLPEHIVKNEYTEIVYK